MKLRPLIVAALVLLSSHAAHAGYAQATPPAGFSANPSGGWQYKAAANEAWAAGNTVRTTATLNVGGRAVAIPASMRMAANAPRFAARALFANPYVLAATVAAPFAIDWAKSKGFFIGDIDADGQKEWVREQDGCVNNVCTLYTPTNGGQRLVDEYFPSKAAACSRWVSFFNSRTTSGSYSVVGSDPNCVTRYTPNGGPPQTSVSTNGYQTKTAPGTGQPVRVTPTEFEEGLAPLPMPVQVPNEIGAPVPVELPKLNPSPAGEPQPLRVPQGTPQAIPNSDPQQYKQPVIDITPAPTTANPWQVSVDPKDVTTTDPNGQTDTSTPPTTDPNAEPSEEGLCERYPGILACDKVDVQDTPLGEVPKLYEPKYPDGLTGVWAAQKDALTTTPLAGLASKMMPTGVNGRSYPEIKIPLDMGVLDFGTVDVSPPDFVWDFGGLVILLSAILLARALVFGG